jgi:hypothetical protein
MLRTPGVCGGGVDAAVLRGLMSLGRFKMLRHAVVIGTDSLLACSHLLESRILLSLQQVDTPLTYFTERETYRTRTAQCN